MQIVAGGPASEWPRRRVGRHHSSGRGSRRSVSLREGGHGRASRLPRQLPGRRQPVGLGLVRRVTGPFRALHAGASAPVPLPAVLLRIRCSRLLAGVVARRWRSSRSAASCLLPFARRRLRAGHAAACRRRRAWLPGLAFGIGVHVRAAVLDARRSATTPGLALAGLEAAFFGLLGAAVRRPAAGCRPGRCGSPSPGWRGGRSRSRWPFGGMPWGRLAFATVGHPVGDGAAVRRRQPASACCSPCSAPLLAWAGARPGPRPGWSRPRRARACCAVVAAAGARAVRRRTIAERDARSRSSRATCPGDGDDILLDHRQVTRNHVDATIAARRPTSRRGSSRSPDFVLWPENSTAVDPFADADDQRRHREAASAPSTCRSWSAAMVDAGHRARAQPGHRLGPGHRGRGPLHQAAPGAVRRVHPVARASCRGNFGRLALIPRDMLSGTRTEPLRVAGIAGRRRDLLRRRLRRRHPRAAARAAPSCSSSRPATRCSSTPARSSSSSRSPGCAPSRPAATSLVAATNGVSGVIAPDGTVLDRADPRTQEVLVEQVGAVRRR